MHLRGARRGLRCLRTLLPDFSLPCSPLLRTLVFVLAPKIRASLPYFALSADSERGPRGLGENPSTSGHFRTLPA